MGLFALVYGFSHVETTSWHDHYTIGSFVVAAVLLGYFFFVQTRTKFPLLPLRVLADRNRGGSLFAMLVAGVGMFGMFLFLTYFLQTYARLLGGQDRTGVPAHDLRPDGDRPALQHHVAAEVRTATADPAGHDHGGGRTFWLTRG